MIDPIDFTVDALSTKRYSQWEKARQSIWYGSRFEQLRNMSSRKKGAEGEKMCSEIMTSLGHEVKKPESKEHDRIITPWKTEIKLSTSWNEELDNFTWQQLRNQDYERCIFIGVNPEQLKMWWCTKDDLFEHVISKDSKRQHAGKDGEQDLYWIQASAGETWFRTMNTWND